MPAPDAKPSPLFFNSARGSRQSPFGRPGSIRQGPPSTARPSTPTSSPLKPNATSTTSHTPPPWLKTAAAATSGDPPSSPSQLRSPSRDPLSSDRPRPLSTASLAAMFDGGRDGRDGRERSSTPPLVSRSSTPPLISRSSTPPIEKAVERATERAVERAVEAPLSPPRHMSPRHPPAAERVVESPRHTPAAERAVESPQHTPAHPAPARPARPAMIRQTTNDALSRLPPPLLHSMRESFSVMDRDDDGHVHAADVADMLSQLGLSATPSALAAYFNGAPSLNLATYLNTLSDLLGRLSRPSELTAAFEAFDDGDDGQIDLADLKDALLHTAPDAGDHRLTEREIDMVVDGFSGRRAFGKHANGLGRADVFRYHDFMASLTGGSASTPTG